MTLGDQLPPRPITPEQVRQARIALGWSVERLARRSKTTVHIVNGFEMSGRIAAMRGQSREFDALAAIRGALEQAGVEFVEETGSAPGVRLQESN